MTDSDRNIVLEEKILKLLIKIYQQPTIEWRSIVSSIKRAIILPITTSTQFICSLITRIEYIPYIWIDKSVQEMVNGTIKSHRMAMHNCLHIEIDSISVSAMFAP